MIRRAQHWTEGPHATDAKLRTRKIKNWANFRAPGGDWAESKPGAVRIHGAPYTHTSANAPLQCSLNDANDVGNRAMVEVRRADYPGSHLSMKALDCIAVDVVEVITGMVYVYYGLWPGCDLMYQITASGLKETVVIWNKEIAPKYFDWTLRYPPSHTIQLGDDILTLLDNEGKRQIETRAPWGEDSSTTAPTMNGKQFIRCTLTEQSVRGGLRVVRLTPNADDMVGAIGTVSLDPTTTLTGPGDIEDTLMLDQGLVDTNFETNIDFQAGFNGGFKLRSLVRIIGTFPVGTLTGFRLLLRNRSVVGTNTASFYAVKSINNWVVSTATWNDKDTATAWSGSGGCGTSGTDHDVISDGTLSWGGEGVDSLFTVTLIPATATAWRDATRTNNGLVLIGDNEAAAAAFFGRSTDWTTPANRPIFEIDYTPPGGRSHSIGAGIGRGIGRGIG